MPTHICQQKFCTKCTRTNKIYMLVCFLFCLQIKLYALFLFQYDTATCWHVSILKCLIFLYNCSYYANTYMPTDFLYKVYAMYANRCFVQSVRDACYLFCLQIWLFALFLFQYDTATLYSRILACDVVKDAKKCWLSGLLAQIR